MDERRKNKQLPEVSGVDGGRVQGWKNEDRKDNRGRDLRRNGKAWRKRMQDGANISSRPVTVVTHTPIMAGGRSVR